MLPCQVAYAVDDEEMVRDVIARGHGVLRLLAKTKPGKSGLFDSFGWSHAFDHQIIACDQRSNHLQIIGEEVDMIH